MVATGTIDKHERIIAGTLTRFDDLARLAGEQWPDLYWRLRDLLQLYRQASEEPFRKMLVQELRWTLAGVAPAPMDPWLTESLPPPPTDPFPFFRNGTRSGVLDRLLGRFLEPDRLQIQLEVEHPESVPVEHPLTIDLHLEEIDRRGNALATFEIPNDQEIRLEVFCFGLDIDEPVRSIQLRRVDLPWRESFDATASQKGRFTVFVEVWQGRELLEVVRSPVEIRAAVPQSQPSVVTRKSVATGGPQAPAPDLLIRVRSQGDQLEVSLDYDNPTGLTTRESIRLLEPPKPYWRKWRREIEILARSPAVEEGLRTLGRDLYQKLFPRALRPALWDAIDRGCQTVQVTTEEPWIPWELMLPYRTREATPTDDTTFPQTRAGSDEDFLGMRFDLARWYQPDGGRRPRLEFGVSSLATAIPDDPELAYLETEKEMLQELADRRSLDLLDLEPPHRQSVLEALARPRPNPIQFWHFAGHGNSEFDHPDEAPVWLAEDTSILPRDLNGRVEASLRETRPAIFLNACRVGQGSQNLVGMAGWASQLLGHCGAGALIAPLWTVSDAPGYLFAKTFYESLPEGPATVMTLARAVRLARLRVRTHFPNSTTWLAYALFAHPNARIRTYSMANASGAKKG